ncbi:hypothetical protein GCM10011369_30790 [Neiella marina]|uniref:GH26 domain-containing protein n=1 Tax=Neiella marina TaxID=508461 RepID=A0A8J2U8G5_9GAMM|nr:glycosyl hydrolase [Neiella marina]GGA86564.1 hypothetical protein GCM10011369_30790 [Neiella marina]
MNTMLRLALALAPLFVVLLGGCQPQVKENQTSAPTPVVTNKPDLLAKLKGQPLLLFIGQDVATIDAYKASGLFVEPAGVVTYTNAYNSHGLANDADWGAGPVNGVTTHKRSPNSALMIGLAMMESEAYKGAVADIATGKFDDNLKQFAAVIRDMKVPVFVRIGHEFEGPWYGYEPESYKAAYRHIVEVMRPLAPNFISVWHSVAYSEEHKPANVLQAEWRKWYPGDDVVDWTGITWFNADNEPVAQAFVDLSRKLNKPLMMAETAPMGYDLGRGTLGHVVNGDDFKAGDVIKNINGDEIWQAWFEPTLAFIEKNRDVIYSLCYINTHWDLQPMWRADTETGQYQGLYWGDSRAEANSQIAARWAAEIKTDKWLQVPLTDWHAWMPMHGN